MSSQLKHQQNWVVTASLSVLALVAIAFVLHYTRDILVPFVIAIFVGSLVAPLMDVMELKWKWRHSISVGVGLVVVMAATALFGVILTASIGRIASSADRYKTSFKTLTDKIDNRIRKTMSLDEALDEEKSEAKPRADGTPEVAGEEPAGSGTDASAMNAADKPNDPSRGGEKGNETKAPGDDADKSDETTPGYKSSDSSEENTSPVQKYFLAQIPKLAEWLLGQTATLFSGGILTVIFVMFVLAGRDPKVVRQGFYKDIDTQVRRYITQKVVLSVTTGLLVWLSLALFEMEMAPVFGVMAFLLNFIPSIGSIISTLIPIPFALAMVPEVVEPGGLTYDNISVLLGVILLPGAVQMIIGNVIEPKWMGDDLQLHPITILLALAVWGLLWGPIGMLLAVPMTAIIRIVLMKFEITRIAGNALAGKLPDLDAAERKAAGTAETSPTAEA